MRNKNSDGSRGQYSNVPTMDEDPSNRMKPMQISVSNKVSIEIIESIGPSPLAAAGVVAPTTVKVLPSLSCVVWFFFWCSIS